jgi:hypothetical protein
MLWTKLYNTNEMKFNRRTSLFIFNYHYILLNFGISKRVMEVKRKGSHTTLDARHRTKTYKTKNTAQKTTKISNTKPPRQKQNEKRIKPSCPWRVSSCCFLPFLFAVGFVSLNRFYVVLCRILLDVSQSSCSWFGCLRCIFSLLEISEMIVLFHLESTNGFLSKSWPHASTLLCTGNSNDKTLNCQWSRNCYPCIGRLLWLHCRRIIFAPGRWFHFSYSMIHIIINYA